MDGHPCRWQPHPSAGEPNTPRTRASPTADQHSARSTEHGHITKPGLVPEDRNEAGAGARIESALHALRTVISRRLAVRVARNLTGEAVQQPRRASEEHDAEHVRDRGEAVAYERQRQRGFRPRRARDARVDDAEQGL